MRRITYRPYLILALFLFCVLSFPERTTDAFRSSLISGLSPCWRGMSSLKSGTLFLLTLPFSIRGKGDSHKSREMERLKQENQILRTQIESVREWLLNEDRLQEQVERLKWLAAAQGHESEHQEFFQRRSQELAALLELQVASLPAQVIFREPSSWSSSIWLNVGEEDNIRLGKSVVGKNSPVLVGTSVIGAIDYVGKRKSRVRLITDSRVKPSVRVVRGREQNRYLLEHLESLIFALEVRQDLFSSPEELKNYAQQLNQLRTIFSRQSHDAYLAKGELQGTSSPLWRSRSEVLKGVGFSYDFSDREGPARDLRSGRVFGQAGRRADPLSILNAGDLLLTTGFDGVFPAGLRVAIVSKVDQLKEGASSYSIEAVSTAGNLDEIHHVSVLPPVSDPQSE